MNYFPTLKGAGSSGIDPIFIEKSAYNTNWNNVNIAVTNGKHYALCYEDTYNNAVVSITNGTILIDQVGNGDPWGSGGGAQTVYNRMIIFTANSSTIAVNSSSSRVYGLIIIQLD